jgi:hypothetical protein
MKRITAILLVVTMICFTMASETYPFVDEEMERVEFDELDDDENENSDSNGYSHRKLRVQKRCRDGRRCRSKYDCAR